MIADYRNHPVDTHLGSLLQEPLIAVGVFGRGNSHGEFIASRTPTLNLLNNLHRASPLVGIDNLGTVECATTIGEVDHIAASQAERTGAVTALLGRECVEWGSEIGCVK